jgi:ABC-2 type transport system permease protein
MIRLGARTLFRKEVQRFLRVPGQTLISPVITTILYLVVFGSALGGRLREVHGVPYLTYIAPGLVMLGIITNSFLNASSSMFISKLQGTIVDLLVAPLRYGEIVGAMVAASAVRALAVGTATWIVAMIFQGEWLLARPIYALLFAPLTAIGFASVGLLTGVWAEKFEHVNFVPTFVITPLTFLGGVFYDITQLPAVFAAFSRFNPILYVVEGMRYALLGTSAVRPLPSLLGLVVFDVLIVGTCVFAFRKGWKLRS